MSRSGRFNYSKSVYSTVSEKPLPDPPREKKVQLGPLRQLVRQVTLTLWLWELLSLLTSICCMGAIFAILLHYDNHAVPNWPYGITINGIISVLAAVAKSALVLPVAEAISQLKWHWFWVGQRPVLDFERFDDASRGPWGSLVMLYHRHTWSLASIGAAVTVCTLAVEPCLQQMPSYPLMQIVSAQPATVPRAVHYSDVEQRADGDYVLSSAAKGAFYSGAFGTYNNSNDGINPSCPTGNCTWPSYSSLGVCSTCENITSLLVYQQFEPWDVAPTGNIEQWVLPNSLPISNDSKTLESVSPGQPETQQGGQKTQWMVTSATVPSNVFPTVKNQTILDMSYIFFPATSNNTLAYSRPQAFECILQFCVRNYTAYVADGVFKETVDVVWPGFNETVPNRPELEPVVDASGVSIVQHLNITNFTLAPTGQTQIFANVIDDYNVNENSLSQDVPQALYDQSVVRMNNAATNTTIIQIPGPVPVFERIAAAMTSRIRNVAGAEVALGKTNLMQASVRARWWWAAFPIAVALFAVGFVLSTVFIGVHSSVPVWKSSSLAALLHGLDEESCAAIETEKLVDMESNATDFEMTVMKVKGRWLLEGRPKKS